jgi:hypothetical protein
MVTYGNAGWRKAENFKGKMSVPRRGPFERIWRERRIPVYSISEFRTSVVR